MSSKRYTIYFENGNVLVIDGNFDNEELIETSRDIAIFIDNNGNEYMISMNNVLYIKATEN